MDKFYRKITDKYYVSKILGSLHIIRVQLVILTSYFCMCQPNSFVMSPLCMSMTAINSESPQMDLIEDHQAMSSDPTIYGHKTTHASDLLGGHRTL